MGKSKNGIKMSNMVGEDYDFKSETKQGYRTGKYTRF